MRNLFDVFEETVSIYGVFYYLGIVLAIVFALFLAKLKSIDLFDFTSCAAYTMIGGMLGAKLLFLAVSMRQIIELQLGVIEVLKGGFVFYGGMLGGLLGAWIYGRQFHDSIGRYLDVFATVLPLGHAMGRIGCFFSGCCYGMEYNGWGCISYETSANFFTPLGVSLLPIQLIEAIGLFFLFIFLMFFFFNKKRRTGSVALMYALSYAVLRFVLEFFRGDRERGISLFSTSQYISIMIAIAVCIIVVHRKKQK